MDDVNVRREKLVQEIVKLPADKLDEVLDFVGYLLSQEQKVMTPEEPLLTVAGILSGNPLSAEEIERELYGDEGDTL